MPLCNFCSAFVGKLCEGSRQCLLRKESTFAESAERCELCRLIADSSEAFAHGQVGRQVEAQGFEDETGALLSYWLEWISGGSVTTGNSSTLGLDVWTLPGKFQLPRSTVFA